MVAFGFFADAMNFSIEYSDYFPEPRTPLSSNTRPAPFPPSPPPNIRQPHGVAPLEVPLGVQRVALRAAGIRPAARAVRDQVLCLEDEGFGECARLVLIPLAQYPSEDSLRMIVKDLWLGSWLVSCLVQGGNLMRARPLLCAHQR